MPATAPSPVITTNTTASTSSGTPRMSTTSMRNVRATRGDGATLRAASAPMGSASTVPISVAPNAIWTVSHRSASSVVNPMPAVSGGQNRACRAGDLTPAN